MGVLSYSQLRTWPTKPSQMGILIPIIDFIKLLTKASNTIVTRSKESLFLFTSLKILLRVLLISLIFKYNHNGGMYLLFYLILISRLMAYALLTPSLITKSTYSVLGLIRIFCIILRFEISFIMLILYINYLSLSFRVDAPLLILPVISILAIVIFTIEINRHPFEIIEGESELVSGYNVELGSVLFIVFFLGEMINIVVISIILSSLLGSYLFYVFTILLLLFLRSALPRIRYDHLISIQWTSMFILLGIFLYLC